MRRVSAQFEGLLLERALEPIESSLGEFGDFVLQAVTRSASERMERIDE